MRRYGVEGGGQPSVHAGADEVLAGDRDLAAVPGLAQAQQRRHEPVVGERLEVGAREDLVERPAQGRGVEVLGQPHQQVQVVGLHCRLLRLVAQRSQGGAGRDLLGRASRRPAGPDQRAHGRQPRDGRVVVQPVATLGPDRRDTP
jgi:hypothetical protein